MTELEKDDKTGGVQEQPAKSDGVLRESPISTDVADVTNRISADVNNVAFSKLGYNIIKAPRETVEVWKSEVDVIITAINSKDLEAVRNLMMRNDHMTGDFDTISQIITGETLDEIDTKLLAIGLFVLREKSPWNPLKSGMKFAKGGDIRMESAFEPDSWANCFDNTAIVKELSAMYGIEGEIKLGVLPHAYFELKDGKVSDVMWGWRRAGLFQTQEKYKDHKRKMGLLGRLGLRKI